MTRLPLTTCLTLLALGAATAARAETLSVQVLDELGRPTSVRMEIRDQLGQSHIPDTAMPVQMKCPGQPVPDEAPACATGFSRESYIDNPHTGTRQFYQDRPFVIDLPPGQYSLIAYKGIEYRVERLEVEVGTPQRTSSQVTLRMRRWAHLARSGWFSADDHLHLARVSPEDNGYLTRWMEAEDLNVANLLQMGNQRAFDITPQFAFGEAGAYRSGDTLILSGQEHPRTHLLGHSVILGAEEPVDLRDRYAVYSDFFKLARRLEGVNGYAHWGLGPAENGLAIDGPTGLLSFVEVLQSEFPHYAIWYQLLNLGIPVAPTAGTDFPCGRWSVPGRERFYTKVEGPLSRESWLDGVRAGRTFVTNGPLLEFRVENIEIGGQLDLARAREVRVHGKVRFDPSRDRIDEVTLVHNGVPIAVDATSLSAGELQVEVRLRLEESAWLALRASGKKVDEAPILPLVHSSFEYGVASEFSCGASMMEREAFLESSDHVRLAEAHTGAIYVEVAGSSAVSHQPRSRSIARTWLAKLDQLEQRLSDENLWSVPLGLGELHNSDNIDLANLTSNREELLQLIARARTYFQSLSND